MNITQSSMRSPDEPVPDAASSDQGAWRWSWPARVAFMFTGVVLPIICFAIGFERPFALCWQSGEAWAYADQLLSRKPSSPFYPFLLYNMTCMTLLVFAPRRFAKSFVVRFAIYTGVLLALQYWLIFAITGTKDLNPFEVVLFTAVGSFLAVFVPWIVGWGLPFLLRKFLPRNLRKACVWCVAALILLWSAATLILLAMCIAASGGMPLRSHFFHELGDVLISPFIVCLLACLFCATPWAVASYSAMAIYVARHTGVKRVRFSLAQLLGAVAWLAAYSGAWHISVLWMLEEYDKLPTTPPPGLTFFIG